MRKKIILIVLILLFRQIHGFAQFNTVIYSPVIKKGEEQFIVNVKTDSLNPIEQDSVATEKLSDSIAGDTHNSINISLPLERIEITSGFGYRFHPIEKKTIFHAGIDLKANYEPFYCFAAGVVLRTGNDAKSGNYIVINHGKLETVYCHLYRMFVKKGDKVNAGKMLGITGNTGKTTGAHLHFGIRWEGQAIDPIKVIRFVLNE
jgi:murein DD-endopeptidase MepM/ murein hydrolase activator NlpD